MVRRAQTTLQNQPHQMMITKTMMTMSLDCEQAGSSMQQLQSITTQMMLKTLPYYPLICNIMAATPLTLKFTSTQDLFNYQNVRIYILFRNCSCLPLSRSFAEFQHTFLIWKHFVWNTFGTPIWLPWSLAQDHGLRVTINTFLWVLSAHRNFTEDLGMLRKSLWTVWRSYQWLGLHPLLSLIFHKFMYKYEAKPSVATAIADVFEKINIPWEVKLIKSS
jgi:hypothetical protein